MILLTRSGSFDEEVDELRKEAVKWVLKAYGPTPLHRRRMCGCPPCRSRQDEEAADRVEFFAACEKARDVWLTPKLPMNETHWGRDG